MDPSTGALSASVPFLLPAARGAVQPSLALVFSSSAGRGVGGEGWSLNLPSIERHNPSGLPQYFDPAETAEITATPEDGGAGPVEDSFTYGGKALVPICFVSPSNPRCEPLNFQKGGNSEKMPTWATGGWHYYRLEVEDGSNLRFFWAPNHQTWVIQEPNGATMELGVPQDNPSDTGGIDVKTGAVTSLQDGGAGPPAVFRWNLVRHYDAERMAGGAAQPTNLIEYVWSKLQVPGSTVLISDLTDIYDTPPVVDEYQMVDRFAHHTHLNYQAFGYQNTTRVERARHTQYLTGVDVTSKTFTGGYNGPREQVRRYVLSYAPNGHQVELAKVQLDGWCSTGEIRWRASGTALLPPGARVLASPACGAGPEPQRLAARDDVHVLACQPHPHLLRTLAPTFALRLPSPPPAIFDVNSDGMPDLIDLLGGHNMTTQQVWLNSVATVNTFTPASITMKSPGMPNASLASMLPSSANLRFRRRVERRPRQWDVVRLELDQWPIWRPTPLRASPTLTLLSPRPTSASSFDWVGVPVQGTVSSIFPGCLQNCQPYDIYNATTFSACTDGPMYIGCDQPMGTIDLDGDGLQDLLVSSIYGAGNTQTTLDDSFSGSSTYSTEANVKFTTRATTGVVAPFAGPPPQELYGICPYSVCPRGPWGGVYGAAGLPAPYLPNVDYYADAPTICVAGVGAGDNPLFNPPGTTGTFADINGDGLPDVVGLYPDRFVVWYGHGDGVFGTCADGTTQCACSQASPVTFMTTVPNQWNTTWSPWGNLSAPLDAKLFAQFHDVDGDGFDDVIVPSADGFDVYFVMTDTGEPLPFTCRPRPDFSGRR